MNNRETIKYLQLPFHFDIKRLNSDLSLITKESWIPHFNRDGYSGEWKAISLYAYNGDQSNIFAFPVDNASVLETPIMKNCIYFQEVMKSFQFPVLSARLLRLGVGAEIKPHRDHELGYEDGSFRLHIPIVTNSDVRFILDGDLLKMLPGECWYLNVNFIHSVSNFGNTDRIHLVIDGKRNEWTDQLFFSIAPEHRFQAIPKENESPEDIKRIIAELKNRKEPVAKKLVKDLQKKLKDIEKQ